MCSVTQHQCRRRQMLGKFSQIHPEYSLLPATKNDLTWLNNLFTVRLQLIFLNKNKLQCVQSPNISVNVAKCVENFHKFTQYTHFFCYKNDLSWLNNLFTVKFQLIRMSSYAKNKLQVCWVTQHQCRRRQNNVGKIIANSPTALTFCLLQKMTCLDRTIYSR